MAETVAAHHPGAPARAALWQDRDTADGTATLRTQEHAIRT
ncbi:hypothetical protein [Streptomyces sp. NBC_00102]|nr:hypothetical protein [Streptomyces sp. NBC_00102]MCX5400215.1 hypothetical protein [Streptomyces sp. NBC_00102]